MSPASRLAAPRTNPKRQRGRTLQGTLISARFATLALADASGYIAHMIRDTQQASRLLYDKLTAAHRASAGRSTKYVLPSFAFAAMRAPAET